MDKPTNKFLRDLKEVGELAGINCGTCVGCRSEGMACREVYTHRFRHTYACKMLWSYRDANGAIKRGVDVKTVSKWMGHSSIAVTQRYLEAMPDLEGLEMVNLSEVNHWLDQPVAPVVAAPPLPVDVAAWLSTPEGIAQFQEFLASKTITA